MIGRKINEILKERSMSVPELSRKTGVPTQTIYSAIKRDNLKIDFDVLLKICRSLGVPVEFFYDTEVKTPSMPDAEEWALLRTYRGLDEHGQELTRTIMRIEEDRVRSEREEMSGDTKIIPLYYTPAAAGYASPAFGEDYEDYEVPASSRADFAARIQGDSMEPYIHDGDTVLVRREGVSNGDVGLFFVDGDMKCKQFCRDNYGNTYLLSLNRNRSDADIELSASSGLTACCFGKVLLPRRPALL